jgi:hypothetical protein
MSRLTTTEVRLVEQYVSVLDYLSRCAQAIDHGDWFYLHDKAGHAPGRPRVQAVRAAVAWFGCHYRAARLLHPDQPGGRR